MMLFQDPNISRVLRDSGWYEGRNVDRDYVVRLIEKEKYPCFPAVVQFLEIFIDLKIVFENKRNKIKQDDINFIFLEATHLEVPERVEVEYTRRIGNKLCLIGSAYREHMVLLMSEDGCVYGAYDSFLCKIANSGLQAIEAIILDYDFADIS